MPSRGGKPVAIGAPGNANLRWIDARRVSLDRQSPDYKRRAIAIADIATGAATPAREDVDEKFWSIPGGAGAAAQPSPDGKWIAFLSDRDGWDHLYVMPAAGGEAVQVTKGEFEAWRPAGHPTARGSPSTPMRQDSLGRATSASRRSAPTRRRRRSPCSRPAAAPTSPRSGRQTARGWSTNTPIRRRRRISSLLTPARCHAAAAVELDARRHAPGIVRRTGIRPLSRPGWPAGPGLAVCTEEPRSIAHASGDRVDSRRWRESGLRRLARAAQLRRLLQLSPVSARAGLCGLRARLPRQHRLRSSLAPGRLHGRRRQGRKGCVDGGALLEDAGLCRHRSHRRLGLELRRLFHADRHDRSAHALSRRRQRRGRRRLRDVLRGSVSRRLDDEPDRHAGAESRRSISRPRRSRTSIDSRVRSSSCTAPPTSTSPISTQCAWWTS